MILIITRPFILLILIFIQNASSSLDADIIDYLNANKTNALRDPIM